MADAQTITLCPSGYISDDYSYERISNIENGYAASDSDTYAQIYLKTGALAETYFYYTFDTSAIPKGAMISEITCSVKAYLPSNATAYVSTRTVQLYSGTTAKGTACTLATSGGNLNTLSTGSGWTYDELTDLRLKLHVKRKSSSTSTAFSIRFFGATLTITYEQHGAIKGSVNIGGTYKELVGGHVNIGGTWKEICGSYVNIGGTWKQTF